MATGSDGQFTVAPWLLYREWRRLALGVRRLEWMSRLTVTVTTAGCLT